MVHSRGYEAQETEPNPTSTASPKTVSVKPENPAGRAEGWSPESTRGESGFSLPPQHSTFVAPSNTPQCWKTSSSEATQMTKCQCVQLLNRLSLQYSPRQHALPIRVWTLAQESQMQPLEFICMSKVLQMSLDWSCGSGPALFYTAVARASIYCLT